MARFTTALLTLGIIAATGRTANAQECWWAGCNPEADLCRLFCGSGDPRQTEIGSQWRAPYGGYYRGAYLSHPTPHWHAKHRHKTAALVRPQF